MGKSPANAQAHIDAARRCGISLDALSGRQSGLHKIEQPPVVYCIHPITGEACYIRRGQSGYTPLERGADVDRMNAELGVEPWQAEQAIWRLEREYGNRDSKT